MPVSHNSLCPRHFLNAPSDKITFTDLRFLLGIYDGSRFIGAGLATIALAGVGVGVGIIFGKLISSLAAHPAQEDKLRQIALLGFALTEAVALFALMMAFLMLFGI